MHLQDLLYIQSFLYFFHKFFKSFLTNVNVFLVCDFIFETIIRFIVITQINIFIFCNSILVPRGLYGVLSVQRGLSVLLLFGLLFLGRNPFFNTDILYSFVVRLYNFGMYINHFSFVRIKIKHISIDIIYLSFAILQLIVALLL